MSTTKEYYVIAGYDLTGCETDKFDDWKYDEGYDEYFANYIRGNIQLFDDPMGGYHLYLGHILAAGDQYEFDTVKIDMNKIAEVQDEVNEKLRTLIALGVITADPKFKPKYEVIVFEECT